MKNIQKSGEIWVLQELIHNFQQTTDQVAYKLYAIFLDYLQEIFSGNSQLLSVVCGNMQEC